MLSNCFVLGAVPGTGDREGPGPAEMSQGYQLRALVLTAFVLVAVVGLPSLTLALGIQI